MSQLPRSTRAGRGVLCGPVGVRGDRRVTVTVSVPDRGPWTIYQPETGLIASARSAHELAAAIGEAVQSVQAAALQRWRQGPVVRRATLVASAQPRNRADVYDAHEWAPDPDRPGVWVSPSGRRYRESTQAVQSVMRKRGMLG